MAFRRKDVKKASYYVFFLGAKESKGLRGEEFVVPILRKLLQEEKEFEPSKVTLQVSNKGLKIVQNVPKKNQKSSHGIIASNSGSSSKTEQIKHFIPHHAITCVFQEEDIVCSILLIYNPITKCPVHVHAYRCDSIETADSLRSQLQILIDRPENQRKFSEIENRLVNKGLASGSAYKSPEFPPKYIPLATPIGHSDGRSIRTDGSDRTEDSLDSFNSGKNLEINNHDNVKVAILYESLAAELKAKLGNPDTGPLLLPAKDYDTIHRKQGKLSGIDYRKSTNTDIVGITLRDNKPDPKPNNVITRSESSGKSSSGIGSEEALPTINEISANYCARSSSSEEERNWSPVEHERNWSPLTRNVAQCHIPAPITPKSKGLQASKCFEIRKEHCNEPTARKQIENPRRYYFPDPEYCVNTGNKQDQNTKLRRQQSNPDYFQQQTRPPTASKIANQMGYLNNGLSSEPFRLSGQPEVNSNVNYRQKFARSAHKTSDVNNRHSFIESKLQRTPFSYLK